jgi:hypothetical protein
MKAGRNNIISYSVSLQLTGLRLISEKRKSHAKSEYEALLSF